jgi:hypothetical protein
MRRPAAQHLRRISEESPEDAARFMKVRAFLCAIAREFFRLEVVKAFVATPHRHAPLNAPVNGGKLPPGPETGAF